MAGSGWFRPYCIVIGYPHSKKTEIYIIFLIEQTKEAIFMQKGGQGFGAIVVKVIISVCAVVLTVAENIFDEGGKQ